MGGGVVSRVICTFTQLHPLSHSMIVDLDGGVV